MVLQLVKLIVHMDIRRVNIFDLNLPIFSD